MPTLPAAAAVCAIAPSSECRSQEHSWPTIGARAARRAGAVGEPAGTLSFSLQVVSVAGPRGQPALPVAPVDRDALVEIHRLERLIDLLGGV